MLSWRGMEPQVDFQFPWELYPRREHNHSKLPQSIFVRLLYGDNMTCFAALHLPSFYIDRFPVTVGEYYSYLQSTEYRPKDLHNWLGQISATARNARGASDPQPSPPGG